MIIPIACYILGSSHPVLNKIETWLNGPPVESVPGLYTRYRVNTTPASDWCPLAASQICRLICCSYSIYYSTISVWILEGHLLTGILCRTTKVVDIFNKLFDVSGSGRRH